MVSYTNYLVYLHVLLLIEMIDWGKGGLHSMHHYRGRRVGFRRLVFSLAMQRHLLLELVFLHLLLPIRDGFHLPMHYCLHPPACVRYHLFRRQRYPCYWWYMRNQSKGPEGPHADESVPPPVDEVVELGSSQVVEDDEPVPPQAFGWDPIELSLLPLYPYHASRKTWYGDVKLVELFLFKLHLL